MKDYDTNAELQMVIAQQVRERRTIKRYEDLLNGKLHVPKPLIQIDRNVHLPAIFPKMKPTSKWCNYGKHEVALDQFKAHPRAPDGLCYKCNACQNRYHAQWMYNFRNKLKHLSSK